ncbi:MAG: hypothetical protein JNK30_01655 [Phenylobacterium sp.]|uniref:hypothetical protein n=1 Tax=Phenylobacterium sp. TaxID=1871053 RepID=UPI001A5D152D|nr:hypothetical protein [Phenylobacterium sp.]MBL8770061.1 hypothetical protein [Phenylobacterium sp.]
MRKTLTLTTVALVAGGLVACKPFWQKDPAPEPAPEAATTVPPQPAAPAAAAPTAPPGTPEQPTAQTEPSKR